MKPTREEIIRNVYDNKLIAIVRGMEPEYCVKLAEALCEGGINGGDHIQSEEYGSFQGDHRCDPRDQ